jgi:hypothetical protein
MREAAEVTKSVESLRTGLGPLRAEYLRTVEAFAERLRPRFESGELYGYGVDEDADCELETPACRAVSEARELVPDFATAYVILACSPAEAEDVDGDIHIAEARFAAAECLVVDAFRLARERGWWRPRAGEWIGEAEWQAVRSSSGSSAEDGRG